jgi:HK97 family phage major capsid protein
MNRKEMMEKKNDLITRADAILENAKKEKRELTDDEAQELAEIRDDVKKIKEFLGLEDDIERLKMDDAGAGAGAGAEAGAEPPKAEPTPEDARACEERRAFENYLRGRVIHERAGELSPSTNPASGGALIPTTIAKEIIKKVYDICPILERSSKFNVKGNLAIPYYDTDTQNITVAYATEFTPLSSSSGQFKSVTLGAFLAGALTKISRSLINNVEFDIVAYVVDAMAYAIKRFIEHELLLGTTNKVAGLSGLTNSITSQASNAITADEIVKLHDAIKDEFQSNAIFIMSPQTRTALRLLKDDMGRYMLQDDISLPFGTSLLGKPVYVSDNMPEIGAGNTCIYYGDMKGLATKFSEDINIEVLREKFADEHAVGVVGWFEFDSKVCDNQKIAKLVCAN